MQEKSIWKSFTGQKDWKRTAELAQSVVSKKKEQTELQSWKSMKTAVVQFSLPTFFCNSKFLQNDEPTLLLYLLLLKSSSFRNYVFAATDIDQLVLPILKVSLSFLSSKYTFSTNHLCQFVLPFYKLACSTYRQGILMLIISISKIFSYSVTLS